MRSLLLTSLLLVGCGGGREEVEPTMGLEPVLASRLEAKDKLYRANMTKFQDSYGFLAPKGDSLLFTCLYNFTGGGVNYRPAVVNGRPLRHPEITPADSKTPISRDMMEGLLYCLSTAKDLSTLEAVITFLDDNAGNLCGKDYSGFVVPIADIIGRCTITPTLAFEIRILWQQLANVPALGFIPFDNLLVFKDLTGFEAHLLMIRLGLMGINRGYLTSEELNIVQYHTNRQPRNALYSAIYHRFTDGRFEDAAAILDNEDLFPSSHNPTSQTRCADYLWQREDAPKDWSGCGDNIEYNGLDFILAYYWIQGVKK